MKIPLKWLRFYHLIVLLSSKGLRIADVTKELQMRHDLNWCKHG